MKKYGDKGPNPGPPLKRGTSGEITTSRSTSSSHVNEIKPLLSRSSVSIPFFECKVEAGFPSPADDHLDTKLNLNEYLVKHPSATFMMSAKNDAMIGAGIHPGDILIVDRSLTPFHNKVVVAEYEGELIVRRLFSKGNQKKLLADNNAYESIDAKDDLVIWGVVTNVIHKL